MARIGGTQFLALARDLSEADCATVMGRLQAHLADPATLAYVGAAVGVSFGWTTRQAGDRASLAELVARSDRAVLEAKAARRAAAGPPAIPR